MIERTYWDYIRNSFSLVQKMFLVALGAVKKIAEPGSVGRGKKRVGTKVGPDCESGVGSLGSTRTDPDRPQNTQRYSD